eukprot:2903808-Karenia_brevis.AAC.1
MRDERLSAVDEIVEKELAALAVTDPPCAPRPFPEVDSFLNLFTLTSPARRRRPFLVIVGGTNLGKSMLASALLQKVADGLALPGFVEVTVEDDNVLDFSDFQPHKHAGVLFDGLGDARVLCKAREVLQGRPKKTKGARSPTMRFAFPFTLCRRAVIVTMDLSASNLFLLKTHRWLRDTRNVVQLWLTAPAWVENNTDNAASALRTPADEMKAWTADETADFLRSVDLDGPAEHCYRNGMSGADLFYAREWTLQDELRLTPFATRKILAARNGYLTH